MRRMAAINTNNNNSNTTIIASFVMKTYQMVDDPGTNRLIKWGRDNNSFTVLEPLEFSRRILPAFFKHRNFSSFVRQLNTYGFRKVDPDRWEFANEWFLRGQTHLLPNIMRKKHTAKSHTPHDLTKHEDEEDDELITKIAKLRHEQSSLEQQIENMNHRIDATEIRPQQMMTFLCKVVEDPEILPRMMLEKEKLTYSSDKKRKLVGSMDSSNSLLGMAVRSSSIKSDEDNMEASYYNPPSDGNLESDANYYCRSSPMVEISSPEWISRHGRNLGLPLMMREGNGGGYGDVSSSSWLRSCNDGGGSVAAVPPVDGGERDGYEMNCFEGFGGGESSSRTPPYPFSLLGGGF